MTSVLPTPNFDFHADRQPIIPKLETQSGSDDFDRETFEFLQATQPDTIPLRLYARPEIRKGCTWDIQLKFSPEIIKQHNLKQIYLEKPRGARPLPFLCLKVRSKLIKPVRELALTKVATILNEGESLTINEFSAITLKVRFTARPRAVFHKHSDMMILLVGVKKGEQTLCKDEFELIFRGGTGSAHSADSRKANLAQTQQQQILPPTAQQMYNHPTIPQSQYQSQVPCHFSSQNLHSQTLMSYQPPPTYTHPSIPQMSQHPLTHQHSNLSPPSLSALPPQQQHQQQPPVVVQPPVSSSQQSTPQFSFTPQTPLSLRDSFNFDDFSPEKISEDFLNGLWSDSVPTIVETPQQQPQQQQMQIHHQPPPQQQQIIPEIKIKQDLDEFPMDTSNSAFAEAFQFSSKLEFSVVHGKRRGMCVDCLSECSHYRGKEGPCTECGCFPSAHLDLDREVEYNKKRLATESCDNHPAKKARFLLNYYQKRAQILEQSHK